MSIRGNWRIVLLTVFVVASGVALFGPVGGAAGDGANATVSSGPTNLNYGLDLAGGTRIRAPLRGKIAQPLDVPQRIDRQDRIARTVAGELGLTAADVKVQSANERASPGRGGSVEVFDNSVSNEEFAAALRAAGLNATAGDVEPGVSKSTRQLAVRVLNDKINRGGLTGGGASVVSSGTGRYFVVVEVPNANRTEVLDLVGDRGVSRIVAQYPTENGTRTVPLLTRGATQNDFQEIGVARESERGGAYVPVTLKPDAARNYSNAMQEFGFTGPGVNNCNNEGVTPPNSTGYCLNTVVDGRTVYAADMSRGLAQNIESGAFEEDPRFRMTTTNISQARDLQINLRAGALPTQLDIDEGTSYYLQPSLAQEFKLFSLVAGLIAWIAVSGAVFVRYGSPRVAVPMLATAAAEVFLLLGFASTVGLALDLSHIAGFIAVIGTGVDDLIIIADEILQEGEVATGRVFQNRFRKAFWVIGAAAATTIVAMSPLTVLSLGDLTGFAIVTIVGVQLGGQVTRPAYGDVLRNLMLD
jgi:preprotein translocase subunit SecD